MQTNIFENRMKELSVMVGSDQSADLFNQEYETLLGEIRNDEDIQRRHDHAQRMRKLLMLQAQYLMNQYIRYQKVGTGPHTIRMQ